MSSNYILSLDHILELNIYCDRIRKSNNAEPLSIIKKISNLFTSSVTLDQTDYTKYSSLINQKIQELNKIKKEYNSADQTQHQAFFEGIKTLLHVKAKIEYFGWSKSLKTNQNYKEFITSLEKLHKFAKDKIDRYAETQKEKTNLTRWIKAEKIQLLYSGYSNEIVYTADEIPLGAVLISNAFAAQAADKLKEIKPNFTRRIHLLKGILCKIFIKLPVTHAIASLGKGKFIHVDNVKDCEENNNSNQFCSGHPIMEDFSWETRKKQGKTTQKYLFGYEILILDQAKIQANLNISEKELSEKLTNWREKLLKAGQISPYSSFLKIISTFFNTRRPNKNYDIKKVFNPKNAYSCSGLISATFASEGIDVLPGKKVDKVSPSDLIQSEQFILAYSNNRPLFESIRTHPI